ncbi:hypothetical protein GCM10009836_64940 [Pseudonocardia ailaonensis]|uniref:VOC domain-containing protein n=1 Tax=Pseudonocardia ailaonensis TaxID=367279 RepID=A0ABN2NLY3_9PSEU
MTVQIAYLVDDLGAAAERWAARGVGPFLRRARTRLEASRDGRPVVHDLSIALAQWGPVMLELVELHETGVPELRYPQGVHHVAEFVDSVAEARAASVARGWPIAIDLVSPQAGPVVFADARAELGHFVEYYEPSEAILALYARVKESAGSPGPVIREL